MKKFIQNKYPSIIWIALILLTLYFQFIDKIKLAHITFIFIGLYIIIFRDYEVKDLNRWYEKMSKKHPILYPQYTPNVKVQKFLAVAFGLLCVYTGLSGLLI